MNRINLTTLICLAALTTTWSAWAQNDSIIERDVVVEREFQPVIQHAGKLDIAPAQVETTVDEIPVQYSTFSQLLQPAQTISTLSASTLKLSHATNARKGWLEAGGGYPLSRLDFGYRLSQTKNMTFDVFARHQGLWGVKAMAKSQLGFHFANQFGDNEVFFFADGNNTYYTRYGRYFSGDGSLSISKASQFTNSDKQQFWEVNTGIGLRSKNADLIRYRVQTGYTAFVLPSLFAEHLIRTSADFSWVQEEHTVGVHLSMQNAFFSIDTMKLPGNYNARHAIRFEPFYEYLTENWLVHAGLNADLNIGKGQLLSSNKNISFAPSPNVILEYRIVPSWIAVYTKAQGSFANGCMQQALQKSPYLIIEPGIVSKHVCGYIPIDAALGLKLKPLSTLYIDLYGKYSLMKNQLTIVAPSLSVIQASSNNYLAYDYSNYSRWTVGAEVSYHYQDIVRFLLAGNFYAWKNLLMEISSTEIIQTINPIDTRMVYDRPSWDLHFRVDVGINNKWSIYSDNLFAGKRNALTTNVNITETLFEEGNPMNPLLLSTQVQTLKTTVDLRLGLKYHFNRWLYGYVQVNNYLNRHNDLFYGYQSQGINGELGICWQF